MKSVITRSLTRGFASALCMTFTATAMFGCGGGGNGTTTAAPASNLNGTQNPSPSAVSPVMSVYAGTPGLGSPAGSGATARFLSAAVWAVDVQGNLYIRDYSSLQKIPPNKDTTALMNWMLSATGAAYLTVAKTGEIYYSNFVHSIGKLGADLLAGPTPIPPSPGQFRETAPTGSDDGQGSKARFNNPAGLVTDSAGIIFVADQLNHTIRKITPAGLVTTFAGLAGAQGSSDGRGAFARFNLPQSLTIDADNNLYLFSKDYTIRRITPDAMVTTLAGKSGVKGWADGKGDFAKFSEATGIAVSALGNIYLADYGNHAIRKITKDGVVTTIAGKPGLAGHEMGALPGVISYPTGVAIYGTSLYFASWNTVVRITDVP